MQFKIITGEICIGVTAFLLLDEYVSALLIKNGVRPWSDVTQDEHEFYAESDEAKDAIEFKYNELYLINLEGVLKKKFPDTVVCVENAAGVAEDHLTIFFDASETAEKAVWELDGKRYDANKLKDEYEGFLTILFNASETAEKAVWAHQELKLKAEDAFKSFIKKYESSSDCY